MSAPEPNRGKFERATPATGESAPGANPADPTDIQLAPPGFEATPERPSANPPVTLRDHFRPPLGAERHWHSFHSAWATAIASGLNRRLPEGYFAEPTVQFGIEIDVAAFEDGGGTVPASALDAGWADLAPTLTVALALLTDVIEIGVFSREGGLTLVGAVELVSPANKDRPMSRDAFVTKCAAYLQRGLGLAIVDVVTERTANLHDELVARVGEPIDSELGDLYAVAYRPVEREGQPRLDIWQERLTVGGRLPILPLWLRGGLCLPVELPAAYARACQDVRLP